MKACDRRSRGSSCSEPVEATLVIEESATYTFLELDAWRNQILFDVLPLQELVSIGIDKKANRIKIGASDLAAEPKVLAVAETHEVPEGGASHSGDRSHGRGKPHPPR